MKKGTTFRRKCIHKCYCNICTALGRPDAFLSSQYNTTACPEHFKWGKRMRALKHTRRRKRKLKRMGYGIDCELCGAVLHGKRCLDKYCPINCNSNTRRISKKDTTQYDSDEDIVIVRTIHIFKLQRSPGPKFASLVNQILRSQINLMPLDKDVIIND